KKHYLNRLIAFSTSGISLPAISLFFFNSSKIILLGGLNFSSLLARGSHGLADDYDELHCLDCVTFPGSLLGCIQQGNFFPIEFFELLSLCRGLEAVGLSNAK
ncbi:Uncharacterized protein APZ42_003942, partial [Daphnia magna]